MILKIQAGQSTCSIHHQDITYLVGHINAQLSPNVGTVDVKTKALSIQVTCDPSVIPQIHLWFLSPSGDFSL